MNVLVDRTIPTPRVAAHEFTEAVWTQNLADLATVIGPEALRYAAVPAAKLVAAIAYLSGSEDPDRFTLSNLLTFHAATKARSVFNHRPSDDADVMRRLSTAHFGSLADTTTVAYGMNLLALISLGDHEHDSEADRRAGKYNPVAEGHWNVATLRAELLDQVEANPTMKSLFGPLAKDMGTMSFWSN